MSSHISTANKEQISVAESGLIEEPRIHAVEPFPQVSGENSQPNSPSPGAQSSSGRLRQRGESSTSTLTGRLRSASRKFEESNLPKGMWDATASIASSIPSLADIRRGSFGSEGWSAEGQR